MTVSAKTKVAQYLSQAKAADDARSDLLGAHVAMTPSGSYRDVLERQRNQARRHSRNVDRRLHELGESAGNGLLGDGLAALSGIAGQLTSAARAPLAMIRGGGGEDKLVQNLVEEVGVLQRVVTTYRVLAELADAVEDPATSRLANEAVDEGAQGLADLEEHLSRLVIDAVRADVEGKRSYDPARTGAGQQVRKLVDAGKEVVEEATDEARSQARQARKVPGVARVEGAVKGAVADASDLPISRYDTLNAADVVEHLRGLSQIDLAKVAAYEAKNDNRSTVLERIESLAGDEPWPGYDELTVADLRSALGELPESTIQDAHTYERRHKNRSGALEVIDAALS